MKYIRQCAIIFGITLVGEWLNYALPLPVPAGVYGLFLLLFLLCGGVVKLEQVELTGNFLLDTMSLMFVPAAVGLMESYREVQSVLVPIVITCILSTVVVMVVTGKVAEFMLKRGKKSDERSGGKEDRK